MIYNHMNIEIKAMADMAYFSMFSSLGTNFLWSVQIWMMKIREVYFGLLWFKDEGSIRFSCRSTVDMKYDLQWHMNEDDELDDEKWHESAFFHESIQGI